MDYRIKLKNIARCLMFILGAIITSFSLGCARQDFPSRTVIPSTSNDPNYATKDMTPVPLRTERSYGGTDYMVPKAYLDGMGLNAWREGTHENIYVEAALPNMDPWTIFGERLFAQMETDDKQLLKSAPADFRNAYDRAFFKDWVSVRVSYGHCFGRSKSQPEYVAKWGKKDDQYSDPLFEKFILGKAEGGVHDAYIPKQQGKRKIYLDCPEYGGVLRRCTAITDYDALVAYEYSFSNERLHEYKEIDDKVRTMLATFIKRNTPSDAMPAVCLKEPVGEQ